MKTIANFIAWITAPAAQLLPGRRLTDAEIQNDFDRAMARYKIMRAKADQ